ncbi:hypothetical protein ACFQML_05405 [Salinirubellus salinus]
MDPVCQNCSRYGPVVRCEVEFERLAGHLKTVRMSLCDVCAESIRSEEWVRQLRN